MVEAVQVDIGEELAGEIADGNGPAARKGGEKVVALEIARLAVVVARGDDLADQPQGSSTFDLPCQCCYFGLCNGS